MPQAHADLKASIQMGIPIGQKGGSGGRPIRHGVSVRVYRVPCGPGPGSREGASRKYFELLNLLVQPFVLDIRHTLFPLALPVSHSGAFLFRKTSYMHTDTHTYHMVPVSVTR